MTTFINKAKPFFVDQIGDTLQGDIDMNNFKITNLKFSGNDNDAVNKKYLLDQIKIDKDHVENRITDVKRYLRRNIKNLVDEPKLQQELTSLKRLIQVDKTSQLQNLISKLDDKITKTREKVDQIRSYCHGQIVLFHLPFESDTVFDRKDQSYKSNKYGFKAEIKVGSLEYGEPKNVFDIGETEAFTFRGNCLIQIEFPMKVKVNEVVFKQTGKAVKHISLFNDGNLGENIRLIDKRDQEIETKNGKYVDTFKMEVENDKDIKDLDMILETENPPSTNIVKIPRRLHAHGKIESSSHEFLRTTDFGYVKLYFALGEKYTSIDVHKSQQEREFIVHLTFAEGSDSILVAGGYIFRAKINIEKKN
ncbi:hypothetical protein LOTGIDRAFT_163237 [Lottia gigantea]|uniref:Uncharacterized protein n=1 Tax=Lottia gigantea TaxID=225164 RepID=V4BSG8_LOTGI|nr:hypothetical protein LOTGIDRAFT_163237 [Lottia gigantea]ESO91874.1 hypothetical protein LOTGIDRAFT_163237 [Lottia gigantea]